MTGMLDRNINVNQINPSFRYKFTQIWLLIFCSFWVSFSFPRSVHAFQTNNNNIDTTDIDTTDSINPTLQENTQEKARSGKLVEDGEVNPQDKLEEIFPPYSLLIANNFDDFIISFIITNIIKETITHITNTSTVNREVNYLGTLEKSKPEVINIIESNLSNSNNSKYTINFSQTDKDTNIAGISDTPLELTTNANFIISRYNRLEKRLITARNNFNPGKKLPPPRPPKQAKPPANINQPSPPKKPALTLENIQTNFRNDFNKFSQQNTFFEPTFQFGLRNGQKLSLKTGFNTFKQPKFESVTNVPLQFGWQTKIEKFTIQTAAGIDIFDRLPIAANFNLQVDRPIFVNLSPDYKLDSALFLAAIVEHGPYKSGAQTLENLITSTRTGLNAYWQIKPNMSFFTLYRIGFFNDGNFEQQSFSRLEHKFGEFYLAGNLFAWTFNRDRQEAAGYFSPKNFLVYNLEAGWEKKIFDFLSCRLNTTIGQQILNGETTNGSTYQARCNARILPNINLDLGYTFSSSRELDTGNSPYNNRNLSGQIQIKF